MTDRTVPIDHLEPLLLTLVTLRGGPLCTHAILIQEGMAAVIRRAVGEHLRGLMKRACSMMTFPHLMAALPSIVVQEIEAALLHSEKARLLKGVLRALHVPLMRTLPHCVKAGMHQRVMGESGAMPMVGRASEGWIRALAMGGPTQVRLCTQRARLRVRHRVLQARLLS